MNTVQTLFIILASIGFTSGIVAFVLPYLKKRGVDLGDILDRTKDVLATVNKTLDVLRPFLADAVDVDVLDKILAAAHVGVGNAEQLYTVGQLEPGQRKEAARQYIVDSAKLIGIEITPEVERLIDGAIESEVLALGHNTGGK